MLRFAHLRLAQLLMAAAGDGSGGGGGVETIEVDLPGGVKVKLPKDEAAKVIAGRDRDKAEHRTLNERLGAVEAEKRAAEERAAEAQRAKDAADALKAGDIKKLEELHTAKLRTERDSLGSKLRDKALAASIAKVPKVVPKAVDDIAAQLRARARYDFDSDSLIVLDAAGQPLKDGSGKAVDVDAFLGTWFGERPYYLLDSTPSGSGAKGSGKSDGTVATITAAEYDAAQRDPVRGQAVSRDIAAKKLRVVD